MKGRESGMPEEGYWESFFEADSALDVLMGSVVDGNIVEFGCGYGSFTLPAAKRATGYITALDIESEMINCVKKKASVSRQTNIIPLVRDFVTHGTGVDAASQTHAMIYNLLHLEQPIELLCEAYRTLHKDGVLSVIHWRSDIPTPRGPSLSIRPTVDQCRKWLIAAGFINIKEVDLRESCPFHYGLLAQRG